MTNDKIKITMFHMSSSGSNNYFLYHTAPKEIKEKYDIELLTPQEAKYNRYLNNSDVYITTHGEHPSQNNKFNIELWHGFPLKGMAKMDKQEKATDEHIHRYWSNVDMIMSYSSLYNTAMNACNGARIQQYQITGLPRNDALFANNSRHNLQKVLPNWKDEQETIIFFLPTFRKSFVTPDKHEGAKDFNNLFGLREYNIQELTAFLKQHNISLVVKLHPFEERFFSEELNMLAKDRIHTLSDQNLEAANLDLYNVLGAADMLMTDYSSVYFDYLLLKRPIIFLPTDLEDYRSNRGLLFEPYDVWAPGPKNTSQPEMQQSILHYLSDPEWYASERNTILNLCHQYHDGDSSSRIWNLIDDLLDQNRELISHRRMIQTQHQGMQQQVKQKIQQIIEMGDIVQADKAIQNYLESNSPDPDIFAMNGVLHLLNNDIPEAIKTFEAGHHNFPWDEDLLYNLGYIYESTNDYRTAMSYYKESLKRCTKVELKKTLEDKIAGLSKHC